MKKLKFIVNVVAVAITLITSGCSITVGRSSGKASRSGGGYRTETRTVAASEAIPVASDPKAFNGVDKALSVAASRGWSKPEFRFDTSKGGDDLGWMSEAEAFRTQGGFHKDSLYSGDVLVRESAHTETYEVPVEGGGEGDFQYVRGGDIDVNASGALELVGKFVDGGSRIGAAYLRGGYRPYYGGSRGYRGGRMMVQREHIRMCGYCGRRGCGGECQHHRGHRMTSLPPRQSQAPTVNRFINETNVRLHNVNPNTNTIINGGLPRGVRPGGRSSSYDHDRDYDRGGSSGYRGGSGGLVSSGYREPNIMGVRPGR